MSRTRFFFLLLLLLSCLQNAAPATYLADALLLDALHRKDVLSGGRQLHSRSDPVAGDAAAAAAGAGRGAAAGGAGGGGGKKGGIGETLARWLARSRAVVVDVPSARCVREARAW